MTYILLGVMWVSLFLANIWLGVAFSAAALYLFLVYVKNSGTGSYDDFRDE